MNVRYYDLYIGGYPADEIESLTKHKYDEGFFGAKYKWSPFIGCISTLGRVAKISFKMVLYVNANLGGGEWWGVQEALDTILLSKLPLVKT